MVFCRGCAAEIHATAISCPKCGALQPRAPTAVVAEKRANPHWLPIVSLVLGVFCLLMLFDDSGWDKDMVAGFGMFAGAGLAGGIISLANKLTGKRIAIAAVVLGSLGVLIWLGMVGK